MNPVLLAKYEVRISSSQRVELHLEEFPSTVRATLVTGNAVYTVIGSAEDLESSFLLGVRNIKSQFGCKTVDVCMYFVK